ncbi:hypothetical protein [Rhodococcus ruber]|uniref:hypothetical protein n=1 Tax=Rhodococcus ruber TaxID=1830 RepID=UPI00265E7AB4|nr:hypothetical protein [Rhodococcus ruber]MDO1481530.1 hypothetical protein [Rhodococcus ruber]
MVEQLQVLMAMMSLSALVPSVYGPATATLPVMPFRWVLRINASIAGPAGLAGAYS